MGYIVIIDDDAEVRLTLKEWCEQAGHRAQVAADGKRGIEMCRSLPVDLVVVDLDMPWFNGFQVMEELFRFTKAKIVAISGTAESNHYHLTMARVLGAERALAKPFLQEDFLAAVNEALPKRPRLIGEVLSDFIQEKN